MSRRFAEMGHHPRPYSTFTELFAETSGIEERAVAFGKTGSIEPGVAKPARFDDLRYIATNAVSFQATNSRRLRSASRLRTGTRHFGFFGGEKRGFPSL